MASIYGGEGGREAKRGSCFNNTVHDIFCGRNKQRMDAYARACNELRVQKEPKDKTSVR